MNFEFSNKVIELQNKLTNFMNENVYKNEEVFEDQLNKNYITASLSNGNILLQKNLFNYTSLNFDFMFSAEHFKKYKPNKLVYLGAASMLNLNIDECERLTFLDISKNCLGSNNTKIKDTESICNI